MDEPLEQDGIASEPAPQAQGNLTTTPLVYILVFALGRRLSGRLTLREPDGGTVLVAFREGCPVRVEPSATSSITSGKGKRPTEDVAARCASLVDLPAETTFTFHVLALPAARGAEEREPLNVLLSTVRAWKDRSRIHATVRWLEGQPLGLHPDADVSSLKLTTKEERALAAIREGRAGLERLYEDVGGEGLSSFLYTLAVTRQFGFSAEKGGPMGAPGARDAKERESAGHVADSEPPTNPTAAHAATSSAPPPPPSALRRGGVTAPSIGPPAAKPGAAPPAAPSFASAHATSIAPAPIASIAPEPGELPWMMSPAGISQAISLLPADALRSSRPPPPAPSTAPAPPPVPAPVPPPPPPPANLPPLEGPKQSAQENFRLATEALERGETQVAETMAMRAAHQDPSDIEIAALVAWILSRRGVPVPESVRALSRILDENPECQSALFYRGTLLKEASKDRLALRDFVTLARLNPNHLRALAEVKVLRGRTKK